MFSLAPWRSHSTKQNGGMLTAEPYREFSRLRDEFDSLFQQLWGDHPGTMNRFMEDHWGMGIDESDGEYTVHLEAPGFEPEEFDVRTSGNRLIVKAEHQESQENKTGQWRRYGQFERILPLPEDAETDQIDAQYHNGVLELKVPRNREAQNAKRISVKKA